MAYPMLSGSTGRAAPEADVTMAPESKAQRTVNAIIHGPTGEKMFLPGRMSMFVPMNVPATAGMIMARSVPVTLFWQWANQVRVRGNQARP